MAEWAGQLVISTASASDVLFSVTSKREWKRSGLRCMCRPRRKRS